MKIVQLSILIFVGVFALFFINETTKRDYTYLEKVKFSVKSEKQIPYKNVAFSDNLFIKINDTNINIKNSI